MGRNNENVNKAKAQGYKMTVNQLKKWNLKYHKLIMGKTSYDILIDDSKWYGGFFEAENNNLEWLTELYGIDWSAFETLGLKKLSKCVELELVDVNGAQTIESNLIKTFQDLDVKMLERVTGLRYQLIKVILIRCSSRD